MLSVFKKKYLFFFGLFFSLRLSSQPVLPPVVIPDSLHVDSSFLQINYYSKQSAVALSEKFKNTDKEKLVVFHFGGSHVQGDILASMARQNFVKAFGNGGRGMVFAYGAANTYSSFYYTSKCKGKWTYGKSFMSDLKLPLGVCGMAVETIDPAAELEWNFKHTLQANNYRITVLTEVDSLCPSFKLLVDSSSVFSFDAKGAERGSNFITFKYTGSINQLKLKLLDTGLVNNDSSQQSLRRFRFYGIDIETDQNSGVVYHSLGVGAAAMRSVLNIEKIREHAQFLNPDIVILDFGTNDILYTNEIDKALSVQVEKAISLFREINPSVHILLTTPQDLYYKKRKLITANIQFRNLMDSLARKNDCLFWDWFDISGGLGRIRDWRDEGYAQPDLVHLTVKGYHVKGQLLYDSFMRTLKHIQENPETNEFTVPLKNYENVPIVPLTKKEPKTKNSVKKKKTHVVKKSDTLSSIARKHKTTVEKIKKLNGLQTDKIRSGQVLRVK